MSEQPSNEKRLEAALRTITKSFGDGAIMSVEGAQALSVDSISTGSIILDDAIGIGGLPKGRIVEIFGPESSGKTTIALQSIANAQRAGGRAAFIDAEHALDPAYAKALGCDLEKLMVAQPSSGEEALSIVETLVRSNTLDIIVVDSVAALVPQAELQGEMGMATMGLQARLMSQACRKLAGALNESKTCCVFTNQMREKIGVMYGSPETTPGGKALKFYASVRIDIRSRDKISDKGEVVARKTQIKVIKNKVAPPFKEGEFEIVFGEGVDNVGSLVDLGIKYKVVTKSGAWYEYAGQTVQGKDTLKAIIKDSPELQESLTTEINQATCQTSQPNPSMTAKAEE
jgi:recombination protein RecA